MYPNETNIDIVIDGKKARALMLKNRVKRTALYYGRKIDRFFVEGKWPKD